jgi:hypothetical protein
MMASQVLPLSMASMWQTQALAQQTLFPFIGGDGINILTSSNIITVSTELYTLIDGGLY